MSEQRGSLPSQPLWVRQVRGVQIHEGSAVHLQERGESESARPWNGVLRDSQVDAEDGNERYWCRVCGILTRGQLPGTPSLWDGNQV